MATTLDITVVSAEGITATPSLFSLLFRCGCRPRRLRPFITITTFPPPLDHSIHGCHVYSTRVDDEGGPNPTWGDKFLLPLDPAFFTSSSPSSSSSCVHLQLHTKRAFFGGAKLLGWAQIPAPDILHGSGPARHLSYRIRTKDGSRRGHGVVNVALRLAGQVPAVAGTGVPDTWRTAIGVPVGTCLMTCRNKEMDNVMNVTRDVSNSRGGKMINQRGGN